MSPHINIYKRRQNFDKLFHFVPFSSTKTDIMITQSEHIDEGFWGEQEHFCELLEDKLY